MTASFLTTHESDDEWDTEVRDSENLDRTLSDIIEGKSPLTTPSKPIPRFNSLDGAGDVSESGGSLSEQPADRVPTSPGRNRVVGNGEVNSARLVSEPSQGMQQTVQGLQPLNDSQAESATKGDKNGASVDSSLPDSSLTRRAGVSSDCDENFNEQTVSDSHESKSSNGDCSLAPGGGVSTLRPGGCNSIGADGNSVNDRGAHDVVLEDVVFKESTV